MPIKVDIVDNNSSQKIKIVDNNPTVKAKGECGIDLRRIELLIKQLQKNKQNLGFVFIDEYIQVEQYIGNIPLNVLNLLTSYLVNKISYNNNVYTLTKIGDTYYEYMAENVNPNTVKVNITSGQFEIFNNYFDKDHAQLDHLDYLSSGHIGFAGIESGTTAYWNSMPNYIPPNGMIVVYTDFTQDEEGNDIPGIKIGDGNAYLIDKPFVGGDAFDEIEAHIENIEIHVSQQDRENWNQKVDDPIIEEDDILVLTTSRYLN